MVLHSAHRCLSICALLCKRERVFTNKVMRFWTTKSWAFCNIPINTLAINRTLSILKLFCILYKTRTLSYLCDYLIWATCHIKCIFSLTMFSIFFIMIFCISRKLWYFLVFQSKMMCPGREAMFAQWNTRGAYILLKSPGFENVWKCFCVSMPFNRARQSELKALNGKFIKVITFWKNEKQI